MKGILIVIPSLNVNAMALFPFILLREDAMRNDAVLLNHERIHLKQQAELLVLPFYILYLFNYLANRLAYKGHHQAYLNIVFEREAYLQEANLAYLSTRRWYNWLLFF